MTTNLEAGKFSRQHYRLLFIISINIRQFKTITGLSSFVTAMAVSEIFKHGNVVDEEEVDEELARVDVQFGHEVKDDGEDHGLDSKNRQIQHDSGNYHGTGPVEGIVAVP